MASASGAYEVSIHQFCGPFKVKGLPCPFSQFVGHEDEPDDDDDDDDSDRFPKLVAVPRKQKPKTRFTTALAEAEAVRTAYM